MLSVTLEHAAKAVGWNEMPCGRDTDVVPTNIVLDIGFERYRYWDIEYWAILASIGYRAYLYLT